MLARTIAAAALPVAAPVLAGPLPGAVVEEVSAQLRSLRVEGRPVDVASAR